MTKSTLDPQNGFKSLASNQVARGIVGTMIMKVASAVVAFALFSLAANASGAEEFGHFSILFSVLSILSIVAVAGQELQVVRSWSEYLAAEKPSLAIGALRYGWLISLAGVLIVGVIIAIVFQIDAQWAVEFTQKNWLLMLASIAFMATNTLSLYSSHIARAIVGIKVGDAHYELTWRSIAIVFLAVCLVIERPVSTTEILAVFALGLLMVITTQIIIVARTIRERVGKVEPEYDTKEWNPRSVRLWLASVMEAANQHLEVFLIGVLLDPIAAGAYFVAARLANSFALAAGGINTFGTRRVPGLYFSRDIPALKHTLDLMAVMSLIILVTGLLAIILAGDYMLMIFGQAYSGYTDILLILSIGTAAAAANGPASSFLMLTGHEGRYMNIVTFSVLYRIAGFLLVVPHYGIHGAAFVTMSVLIIMTILLHYLSKNLTGMDSSILRLVWPSPDMPPKSDEKAMSAPSSKFAEGRAE